MMSGFLRQYAVVLRVPFLLDAIECSLDEFNVFNASNSSLCFHKDASYYR